MRTRMVLSWVGCVVFAMAAAAAGGSGSRVGGGTVFLPNPIADLRDQSLNDQKDADYAALQPAYHGVTLKTSVLTPRR